MNQPFVKGGLIIKQWKKQPSDSMILLLLFLYESKPGAEFL